MGIYRIIAPPLLGGPLKYEGKNIVKGYKKHFGVDILCAITELQILGITFTAEYINSMKKMIEADKIKRQEKKQEKLPCADSDDTFYYIAGYTSGGAPYGITWEEAERFVGEDEEQGETAMTVKIKELVDEMDMQMDEYRQYLNRETGMILTVSNEDMAIAEESEEDDDFSQYSDWQRESIQDALDILENWDKYIELPDKWEIDEYHIMESFCGVVDNNKISDDLYDAIRGKGAFRRFKDTVKRYRLEDKWYSYHEEALKDIAIDWCKRNNIRYQL